MKSTTVIRQEINQYLSKYSSIEVLFNSNILNSLNIDGRQILLKYKMSNIPCTLYSASFKFIKILMSKDLQESNNILPQCSTTLKVLFTNFNNSKKPFSLFMNTKVAEIKPYEDDENVVFIVLAYHPVVPNDFVSILGKHIEEAEFYSKRKAERINIDPITIDELGFESRTIPVGINNNKVFGVLKDISMTGTKVILKKDPYIKTKNILEFFLKVKNHQAVIKLTGIIVRVEQNENNPELVDVGAIFDTNSVPKVFIMIISHFISNRSELEIKKLINQESEEE